MIDVDPRAARLLQERPLRTSLAQDLASTARGDLSIHWLGQAGFVLRYADGTILVVDAYLSDSLADKYRGRLFPHTRLMAAPIRANALPRVDLVLVTHGHTDHMDPGTLPDLATAYPTARFVVPRRAMDLATSRGVPADRMHLAQGDDALEPVRGIQIHAVPAAHERLDIDSVGSSFLGYVIEAAGHRIYHSGDCIPFDGLVERLRALSPTIALLPVNGRDKHRSDNGVPGNFSLDEAIRLCEEAGIPQMVAHHWGMFDFNTVNLDTLQQQRASYRGPVQWYVPSPTSSLYD